MKIDKSTNCLINLLLILMITLLPKGLISFPNPGFASDTEKNVVCPTEDEIAFDRAGSIWVLNMRNRGDENFNNKLKELMTTIVGKIENDIDITATAFADAQNIQRSMRWVDIFGTALDIVTGTIDTISSIVSIRENLSQGLSQEFLKYEFPLEALSGLLTVDSLIQRGERLQLAIDGPSYSSNIKTMLDEAYKESSTFLFFNYNAYKTAIKLHLLGDYNHCPLVISHKSPDTTRRNIHFFNTFRGGGRFFAGGDLEKSIRTRFRYLIEQLKRNPPSYELERELVSKLDIIRKTILRSKLQKVKVRYETYLEDGDKYIAVIPEIWLGNVGELEKVRINALTNFSNKLKREEILTINKAVSGILNATTINLNITYQSSELGTALGQISKVFVLPPGIDFSQKMLKRTVYKTNPRDQVNMIPQGMVLTLSKEFSDLWMIADDVVNFIEYKTKEDLIKFVESIIKREYGYKYRLAGKGDLHIDQCRTGAFYNDFFPYLIVGDFNGDSRKPDLAFIIVNSDNNSKKLVVIHVGNEQFDILENDFQANLIEFFPKRETFKSPYEELPLNMIGDSIHVIFFGTHSYLYYWDGNRYRYYAVSD